MLMEPLFVQIQYSVFVERMAVLCCFQHRITLPQVDLLARALAGVDAQLPVTGLAGHVGRRQQPEGDPVVRSHPVCDRACRPA